MPELVVIAEQLVAAVPGGAGRYTRELLAALAATAPDGWEVTAAISRTGDPDRAAVDGVGAPKVLPLPRKALITAWEHGLPLWPGGDSVHAMTPLAPPRKRGRGLVVTVHDTVPWTHPETLTPRGVAWHRRAIGRATRDADTIVVPTEAVAADLANRTSVRAAVQVVGEGVSPALLAEPEPDHARIVAATLPPRFLLIIGTLEPRKGHEHLIEALARPEAPAIPLVIVGEPGWGDVDPLRLAERCGLPAERVRVLRQVGDAELAVLLRLATALVAPSLAEGFGLPLIEAMAVGTPVVHSDVPALVEVAGTAGLAVRRADPRALARALRLVVDDPDQRAKLAEAGPRRAEHFSWDRAARDVWRAHLGRT
ncbi:glycosyltransferase family 1 protein [Saccharopolyspora gloriosae]|uniref:Glycosyltransferase involved in cell wall biosynthesis n=1 Tax=Saccharopolyspora gloriosae TaxID=455344 RepID=A0A840NRL0_9PSEU|nr:glycosyltransferase involved in cell wall biosynthesis [Saccharopolyspora gloriosae]